jgi:hypothetical protein
MPSGDRPKIPYDCSKVCESVPDDICILFTRGYCSGYDRVDGDKKESTDVAVRSDEKVSTVVAVRGNHRGLRLSCIDACCGKTRYICVLVSYGYCEYWYPGREEPRYPKARKPWRQLMDTAILEAADAGEVLPPVHCPTYCRRLPSSLCESLTLGYCTDGNNGSVEEEDKSGKANDGDVIKQSGLRGMNNDVNDGCKMAIDAIEEKFGELVGDLEDQKCALAIMKANIEFTCSAVLDA